MNELKLTPQVGYSNNINKYISELAMKTYFGADIHRKSQYHKTLMQ